MFCIIIVIYSIIVNIAFTTSTNTPPIDFNNIVHKYNNNNDADKIEYRLPNLTVPVDYKIDLKTDIHKNKFNFEGVVTIKLKVSDETPNTMAVNRIVIHARQLRDFKAGLMYYNKNNPNPVEFANVTTTYDKIREFLTIKWDGDNLKKSIFYYLQITYKGTLRKDNLGFYRSSYQVNENQTVWLATTQFESTEARHAFPCYDEPSKKAKFKITIRHGKNYSVISNMPIANYTIEGEYNITNFEETPDMSTYLVAFVISDFEYSEKNENDLQHAVYSKPGTLDNQAFALDTGIKTLSVLAKYLKVDYSLPKMQQIAIPDFAAGAMENWGLVTYRETALLYNTNKSTIFSKTSIANVIAHEFVHQWFGNLVTPKWWMYIWLNEGFATLFSYIANNIVFPDWQVMDLFMSSQYRKALDADAKIITRPMTHYVEAPKDIAKLFDYVNYAKAGSILRMFQHVVTERAFQQALTNYLKKKMQNSAEENDLFVEIANAAISNGNSIISRKELIAFMSSWTHNGGHPVVTVWYSRIDASIGLMQETFIDSGDRTPETDKKRWSIPINIVVGNDPDFEKTTPDFFLDDSSMKVYPNENHNWTKDDWIILNKQQTGFYRVNYPDRNWEKLSSQLLTNLTVIHAYNRAQLIDDSFKLSLADRLKPNIFLKLLEYVKNEREYLPWLAASGVLTYLDFFLDGSEIDEEMQFFIRSLVNDIYNEIGTTEQENEPHLTKFTRKLIMQLACRAEIEDCIDNTRNLLNEIVKGTKDIHPNLKETIYCYGLQQSPENFDNIYRKMFETQNQAERNEYLSALGCSRDQNKLKILVESSINRNATYKIQERLTVLNSAYSRSRQGLLASIRFLNESYKEYSELISDYTKINPLQSDIRKISSRIFNEQDRNEFVELVLKIWEELDILKEEDLIFIAHNMNGNLAWIDDNFNYLKTWLKDYKVRNGAITILGSTIMISFSILLTLWRN